LGKSLTGQIKTVDNPTDLATNIMANAREQTHLVNMSLYDIFDEHDEKGERDGTLQGDEGRIIR